MMTNKELGDLGEHFAENYLMNDNYKILTKNFRYGRQAEIDIIVERDDVIVFVEVKTRSSLSFGSPAEAVDYHKRQKIILAANYFLQLNNFFERACRFDVIEVYATDKSDYSKWEIRHIENAFEI